MKYLQNKIVDEFFDKTEVKVKQHEKAILVVALIPILLMTLYIFHINNSIETPLLILLGIAMTAVYLTFVGAGILAVDCWVIAEMVSPSVIGRYKKFRTFVQIVMNSPTRQEILRVTKLYNDIIEKNGIENYQSASKFVNNVYDRLDKQDHAIKKRDEIINALINDNSKLEQQIKMLQENDTRQDTHIARQNLKSFHQNWEIKKLQREKKETDQLVNDKILTKNTSKNTKAIKDSNKLDFSIE